MSKITDEEFYNLLPKQLRRYKGGAAILRNCKFIEEGLKVHKIEAFRNIRSVLDYNRLNDAPEILLSVPFFFSLLKKEIDAKIKLEICRTLKKFMQKANLYFDEDQIEFLKQVHEKEFDETTMYLLEFILMLQAFCGHFSSNKNKKFSYLLNEYFDVEESDVVLNQIINSESYKIPLPYKMKKKKSDKEPIEGVYFTEYNGHIKIGRSYDLENKKVFPILMPYEENRIHFIKHHDSVSLEKYFHNIFKAKRVNGEWFNLSETDIEKIKSY